MARGQSEQTYVGDLPTRAIPAIPERLTMGAARKVAALKRTAVLFVERDGRLVGVLDEAALADAADDAQVAAVMKPFGICLHPATSLARARELFAWSRDSVLPVTVGAFLIGAIARADVERALAEQRRAPAQRRALRAKTRSRTRAAA